MEHRSEMEDALTIDGLDAAPNLGKIVRDDHTDFVARWYALGMLCRMDRFVPRETLPLPNVGDSVSIPSLNLGGRLDPIMIVDGRRIGTEAFDAVHWAAEQSANDGLRFLARSCSGLLDQDLRSMPIDALIRRWREEIIASKGVRAGEVSSGKHHIWPWAENVIVERGHDSLPQLVQLLRNDPDPYVREELVIMFQQIDSHVLRLRTAPQGEDVISAIHHALLKGNLKPFYNSATKRDGLWNRVSAQMLKDEIALDPNSDWALFAQAFETFYGEKTTVPADFNRRPGAVPDFRPFVTYLTAIDPSFPSWEYTYLGLFPKDQIFDPGFRRKVDRYHQVWQSFKNPSTNH